MIHKYIYCACTQYICSLYVPSICSWHMCTCFLAFTLFFSRFQHNCQGPTSKTSQALRAYSHSGQEPLGRLRLPEALGHFVKSVLAGSTLPISLNAPKKTTKKKDDVKVVALCHHLTHQDQYLAVLVSYLVCFRPPAAVASYALMQAKHH